MYKDNAVGNMVAETGRDFGTTVRHDWAIFQCRWQTRFDAHLNRPQGHRRQPIARSGNFLPRAYSRKALDCAYAFSQRAPCTKQRCWKRGSGDGQRLTLYDYGTTERSFNAVERWGSTLTWTVCTAADSEEQQICTTCLYPEGVGLWKDDGLMLSPIVEHTSVWDSEGVGGRGEIWRANPQWNTKDQLPKPQTATVATAQWPK